MEARHVKFPIPFLLECGECQSLLFKGSKVHASKEKSTYYAEASYFSVPIYEYRFNCKGCSKEIILKNNPELSKYEIVSGCSKNVRIEVA